jgi:hypothetical protein
MTSLTADETMLAVLRQVNDLTEIRDASGSVVGYFAPIALDQAQLYVDVAAHCDPTEIEKRKTDNQSRRPTPEVLERIQTMEKP